MIDSHVHPVTGQGEPLDLSSIALHLATDDESRARRTAASPGRLSQELMAVRLAEYLRCEIDDLGLARSQASAHWPGYVSGLFSDAGIKGVVLDPGTYLSDPGPVAQEMAALTGAEVRSIMRIDPLVDQLITDGATASEILAAAEDAVRQAPAQGYVGLKTILAYRTGLKVDPGATEKAAEESLRTTKELPTRRRGKALRDLITRRMMGWAAELDLPVQIHTGFGDSEIRLSESSPLFLEELLLAPEGTAATVVLIHGSYPWHEELAFLTLVHPNVHAELSLFNLFAPARSAERLERVLELAPASRVLCGTDGHGLPESYWFAAHELRNAWTTVRKGWVTKGARKGWLDGVEDAIFRGNTARLYKF